MDYKDENNWLMLGDCLERMKEIPDGSIDMILCDLPYGTTSCKWDSVIPFDKLWESYERVIKKNGAIILTSTQPFTTLLISSNLKWFKYSLIWAKNTATGFMQAKTKPLNSHEDVLIFGQFSVAAQYFNGTYNPQGVVDVGERVYSNKRKEDHITGNRKEGKTRSGKGYPKSILNFNSDKSTKHPTQKPVDLMEYLINTYTNSGETVLDNCMGSRTTGVACRNLNRKFIGIEMDKSYFNISKERILG